MRKGLLKSAGPLVLLFTLIASCPAYASSIGVSEQEASKTVKVKIKDSISIELHSTYWDITPSTNKATKISEPVISPILPGENNDPNCQHMGSGCGTKIWKVKFAKVGKYKIVAQRTSCGEALACNAKQSHVSFIFVVSK